jgi:hypothetical protein
MLNDGKKIRLKPLIIVMIICLPSLLSFSQETARVYTFDDPVISEIRGHSVVRFPGAGLFGEPAKPVMPFYPVRLMLPPGTKAAGIEIEWMDPVTLPGRYELLPQQAYRPVSYEGTPEFLKDSAIYLMGSPFPGQVNYEVSTHYMNGVGFALSAFTPLSYIPSEGRLTYYRKVRVKVRTETGVAPARALDNLHTTPSILSRVRQYAQNPEALDSYLSGRSNPPRTGEYRYLMITTATFAPELDTLIRFYEDIGILARCYTLDYIDTAATGSDMQEKIRNFITEEYQDNAIEYVLLGGDNGVIPYRGFYCTVLSGGSYLTDYGIPSDLYFSALDGSWNDDGDSRWGEPGEDDLLPEVAVGRMTFSDTAELHNMLHKAMMYQASPVIADLNQPLMAGEHLWSDPLTWGSDYLRLLIGYHSDSGYITQGIPPYHDIDTLYDRYSSWSRERLIDSINNGHSFVHHVGHANYTSVMKMSNYHITNANFSQVDGIIRNYPVIYTHGCNCGGFDYSDCIAEKMIGIDNFAVAFVGNSRYGWFVEGTADGPSQHLHREFVDALYSDSLYRIGMTHMQSKAETAPFIDLPGEYEPGAHRWCFYDCNVLGDPMLALWTDFPHDITVTYPTMIPIGADSISVTVRHNGSAMTGMVCALFRADTLIGCGQTDSTGNCSFMLTATPVEGLSVLRVSGNNVLPHDYDIPVADYWIGNNQNWDDPENWYTGQVPDEFTNVVIPADPQGDHFPILGAGKTCHCKNMYLEEGASFQLGSNDILIIHGN